MTRLKLAAALTVALAALIGAQVAQAAPAPPCSGTFGPTVNANITCTFDIASFELTTNVIVGEIVSLNGYECSKVGSIGVRCTRASGAPPTKNGLVIFTYEGQTIETCSKLVITATARSTTGQVATFPLTSTCGGSTPPPSVKVKPGCGPKKTNGVNPSGTHTGQPPKNDPARSHCPPNNP